MKETNLQFIKLQYNTINSEITVFFINLPGLCLIILMIL
jgi:hypothetical protein